MIAPSPWTIVRQHKHQAACALVLGIVAGAGVKYLAAALLIIWLLTGGR